MRHELGSGSGMKRRRYLGKSSFWWENKKLTDVGDEGKVKNPRFRA